MKPHRGTLILILGILGLTVCLICGIVAWIMGNADLKEMQAGTMDPSGMGLTKAGKICGMVACILAVCVIGLYIVLFVVMGVAGVAGAGAAGSTP